MSLPASAPESALRRLASYRQRAQATAPSKVGFFYRIIREAPSPSEKATAARAYMAALRNRLGI